MALLGLFTFFALVDDLDNVGDKFSMMALLYMQALAIPTRLYDLLPIGLLIGAILALAGLAQRNELVILGLRRERHETAAHALDRYDSADDRRGAAVRVRHPGPNQVRRSQPDGFRSKAAATA